jgi:hypothetical protein
LKILTIVDCPKYLQPTLGFVEFYCHFGQPLTLLFLLFLIMTFCIPPQACIHTKQRCCEQKIMVLFF